MIKFFLTITLIAAAFFANMTIPQVATVTFAPDTTLSQVVDLLNQHNTWADDDIFITTQDGSQGFFYFKDSMPVAEREEGIWITQRTFAHLDKRAIPQQVTDCIATKNCPVTIAHITLLNPPATLLDAPIIASSETHRDLHPFFRQILGLGRH